jgi:ABC-2 type transport system ATP-binding protein
VLATPDPHTMLIECALGKDIREEVARFAVRNEWGLLEMKPVSMTLEDVFLQLTQHEDGMPRPDFSTETNQH